MERLQFSWSLLPYYSAFLAVVAGVYGIFQRDFIGGLLAIIHPIRGSSSGKRLAGPAWAWPNGQLIDKFLSGYERSAQWRRHGSVYRIWASVTPEVVITQPEDVRAFFTDSGRHAKARGSNAGWFFEQLLGECLGQINDESWTALHGDLEPKFTLEAARERFAGTVAAAERFLRQLKGEGSTEEVLRVEAADTFKAFPFLRTADIIYGPMTAEETDRLWHMAVCRMGLLLYIIKGGVYRFWVSKYVDRKSYRKLRSFKNGWLAFNQGMFQKGREERPQALIQRLWPAVVDNILTREQILQTFDEMLFANLDVTTHILSWIISFIASSQSVQSGLRAEIMNRGVNSRAYIMAQDTYLHYCLLETLRLRPVAAFTIPESSPSNKIFSGVHVPAKTDVIIDTLAINVRNSFWGNTSNVFDPSRFYKLRSIELRYNLFTFGFGARKCLGQHEAQCLIKTFVAQLVLQYDLSLPQDTNCITVEEGNWVPAANIEVELKARA